MLPWRKAPRDPEHGRKIATCPLATLNSQRRDFQENTTPVMIKRAMNSTVYMNAVFLHTSSPQALYSNVNGSKVKAKVKDVFISEYSKWWAKLCYQQGPYYTQSRR